MENLHFSRTCWQGTYSYMYYTCYCHMRSFISYCSELLIGKYPKNNDTPCCLQFSLVLPLWVKSCRPYLEMIDKWLYNGLLYDPFQEFIISM